MSDSMLSADTLRRALSVPDLTDPTNGPHALQVLVGDVSTALRDAWGCTVIVERASPIVSVADNYDRLHYPAEGAARDARYTRYVCTGTLLRTQTSAMIPPLLQRLAVQPPKDALLVCPGLVYRRDCIDRLHTGEPHQLDLWRITRGHALARAELDQMIALAVGALLPGRAWRTSEALHPYTSSGMQIDVQDGGAWIEIGECGLALPALLSENGHPVPPASGLAMGLGLDRILMLRKGLDDIRLLRSSDPRVSHQMRDLAPYRVVSSMPPVRRDLSLAVAADTTPEELGDGLRSALAERADDVECVELLAETAYAALPVNARERLGMLPGQKNALLRVTLRALDRTLTHAECNQLRDAIYAALHRGTRSEWAGARN